MFNIKHSPVNSAAYCNLPVLLQSDQDLKNFWNRHVVTCYPIRLTILLISIGPLLIKISLLFQKNKKKGKKVHFFIFCYSCLFSLRAATRTLSMRNNIETASVADLSICSLTTTILLMLYFVMVFLASSSVISCSSAIAF
jgi:hypothetical protein